MELKNNNISTEAFLTFSWIMGRDCWTILPVTIEHSWQWLLNNHASHCWRIVPTTVEESYQSLLKNRASDCWTIVPVTAEQSCQLLLNYRASDWWTILLTTVEHLFQWPLKNSNFCLNAKIIEFLLCISNNFQLMFRKSS